MELAYNNYMVGNVKSWGHKCVSILLCWKESESALFLFLFLILHFPPFLIFVFIVFYPIIKLNKTSIKKAYS